MFEAIRSRMKGPLKAAVTGAGIALALCAGKDATATALEGALLTNIASASYWKTDGSPRTVTFNATFAVFVKTPNVMMKKTAFPSMQAAGGVVYFCITFSNHSRYTTAFNLVMTDQLPVNMSYVGHDPARDHEYVADPTAVLTPSFTLDGGATWTDGAWLTNGQEGGPNVRMRWTINELGPGRSGLLCFLAKVL